MKVRKFHVYLTLVMISTGFLISNSIEVTKLRNLERQGQIQLQEELRYNEQIVAVQEENRKLVAKLMSLQQEVNEKEKAMAQRQSEAASVLAELETARMMAGVVAVEGPGIVVTMQDNPNASNYVDITNYIVHENDIWRVVNELYAAGAEAISINGQRLVSNSSIRCVGPTVIVNGVKSAAPFVITAIGDSSTLESALYLPNGIMDYFNGYVKIEVAKKDHVQLPAFVGDKNVDKSIS